MNVWRRQWRQLRRDARGARGRVVFFAACLAVGVAAVTAVAGLAGAIEKSVRGEARQLLAADLAISARRPLPATLDADVQRLAARRADIVELVTVVVAKPRTSAAPAAPAAPTEPASEVAKSQLVELKAVRGGYPFYGVLTLDPPLPLERLLSLEGDVPGAVVGPELLTRLRLAVGDHLSIGGREFAIRGQVLAEPDRVSGALSAGPRVFVGVDPLQGTTLLGLGSRVRYRALLALPGQSGQAPSAQAAEAAATALRATLADEPQIDVESFPEGQPGLRDGVRRAERFLGLVALLSLLLGGVGVAQTVRSWLQGRLDAIAVLKCLGSRPREIFVSFLAQTALLALIGSALGVAFGLAIQWSVPAFLGDWPTAATAPAAKAALREIQPAAILRGLGLGLSTALLFGILPVSAALRVPALRVLRRDADPLPAGWPLRIALGLLLTAGVTAIAASQARSLRLGIGFTAALGAAFGALALAGLATRWLAARWPRRGSSLGLRLGLASLDRPNAPTLSAIVALGFGAALILALWLVESQLSAQLTRQVPDSAPTAFLVDVQPAQWEGAREVLANHAAADVHMVPVVMARIGAIDGVEVKALTDESRATGNGGTVGAQRQEERADRQKEREENRENEERRENRWALTREQRLTFLDKLPEDNTLIAGTLWGDASRAEVSVEEEYARDLGLRLGSRVRFDVQGVPVELTVTSLRRVRWESFGINFFWVVEPGVLDEAPQWRLASARLVDGTEQRVQDQLAERYPNVTLIKIREILEKVAGVLRRMGGAVRFLGAFTALAGVTILAGAVSAGEARRQRDAALYKTLGMTRFDVASAFAGEYALIGLVAGIIGTAAGLLIARLVLVEGMDMKFDATWAAPLSALVATVALAVVSGLSASVGALRRRPIETLRLE